MLKAVLLGLVQGVTEFLPISSSGHLVLGQYLIGLAEPEILFDVVLHLGTLLAVLTVFRNEVVNLLIECLQITQTIRLHGSLRWAFRERPNFRLLVFILAGSIPTGLIGFFFKDLFERMFASPLTVGLAWLVTGTVLFFTKYFNAHRDIRRMSLKDSLIIGVTQGLAITPGISRSGMTISTGLFLGLDRELAGRYSFLLFIPAIFGALLLQISDASGGSFSSGAMVAGFTAAFISGLAALVLLLRLVKGGRLYYFSGYCWLAGLVAIIFFSFQGS